MIVPVLNDAPGIAACLEALLLQTYPPSRYEIIVADNGSTDGTRAVVERIAAGATGRVRLVIESAVRSSYAARNRALQEARGEIIACTDADCTPTSTWLQHGVRVLVPQGTGAVAGRVDFTYRGERPNAFEYWDSAVHMNQERLVRRFGYGATANLFTYARMFERHGPFRSDLMSGGDKEFGYRLRLAGEPVSYASDAVVRHPARATLAAAFAKSLRLARAHRRLHRLGVLSSRRACARRLLQVVDCPRPMSWEGQLSSAGRAKVILLRNLDAWLSAVVCLSQETRDRVSVRRTRSGAIAVSSERPVTPTGELPNRPS